MPARRSDSGWTQEERLAILLTYLYDHPKRLHTTERLRQEFPFYSARSSADDEARRKLLNRDLDKLISRGFVERYSPDAPEDSDTAWDSLDTLDGPSEKELLDESAEGSEPPVRLPKPAARDNRRQHSGIRVVFPEKNRQDFLAGDEHKALARARIRFRPGPAPTSPFAGEGDHDQRLDRAGMVLRYLEESGQPITVDELAEVWGVSLGSARDTLTTLDDIESEIQAHATASLVEVARNEEGAVISARIPTQGSRQTFTHEHPGRTPGGLNALARATYTREETLERLDLIDTALAHLADDDADAVLLASAGMKLGRWLGQLNRLLPPTSVV